ncbi:MAG: hypothetical protein A3G76_08670 [Acidobacteria bacterium RIFCSPLOWO2_12_FULL_65_11]|nr:MAG: hypothetical protein A3H95_00515 [Acidobacteria bacterium RIFCSPLOWO2_02_FULL_64_15]OFW32313.1 MAG: hypothetical protein A3G76_08670 [Acidobacteria bacterium RIFCSPLOWO2_12_FULL_65_11]
MERDERCDEIHDGRAGGVAGDGLHEPGAPRTITDEQVEQVIIRTLETTPRGATHCSVRDMAHAVGLSRTAISRIWHTFTNHRDRTLARVNRRSPKTAQSVRLNGGSTGRNRCLHRGTMPTARSGAPLPPAIFIGSATMKVPVTGRRSRALRFSKAGMSCAYSSRCDSKRVDWP